MSRLTVEQAQAIRAFAVERADELGELAIDRVLAERSQAPNRQAMRRAQAVNREARKGVARDLEIAMLRLFAYGRGGWTFDRFDAFKAAVRSGEFHDWESLKENEP
jgi:hypothetical protein